MSQPAASITDSPAAQPPAGSPAEKPRYPAGIRYIIGNEACERFSFYGMKSILWMYMAGMLAAQLGRKAAEEQATSRMHLFIAGVYAFPMIGALLSDRLLGKYRTIFWLSLVYCVGQAAVALTGSTEQGLFLGLALIAVGSGGIKPCVSALVGDQFSAANSSLVSGIYQIFYFTINLGSFFATLAIPFFNQRFGPTVAFGVPGVLMFVATAIFWLGRNKFRRIEPKPGGKLGLMDALASISLFLAFGSLTFTSSLPGWIAAAVSVGFVALGLGIFAARQRIQEDNGFLSVLYHCVKNAGKREPGEGFFGPARRHFGEEAAEGGAAVLRIAGIFATVSLFWALFDQHSSSWIAQAKQMDLAFELPLIGRFEFLPSQTPALNPALVMLIIPGMNFLVYPALKRLGIELSALKKMSIGMFLAAISFAAVALIQMRIDGLAAAGGKVSVAWQLIPYVLMTVAEVLVSATGLEFAYTQAPRAMKSTVLGLWLLTVTVGNLLVSLIAHMPKLDWATFFWTFTGLMLVAAGIFSVVAYFYKVRTYLQE